MADNKSQAQHLASLDFDISGIIETLKQVDEQTKAMGLQVGKNFSQSVQDGAKAYSSSGTAGVPFLDDQQIINAKMQLQQLSAEYGKLVTIATSYNEKTGALTGTVNYERFGQKMSQQFQYIGGQWELMTTKQQENYNKLLENAQYKNRSMIDAEIAERERQSKVFSAQIKEQMTLRVREENEAKNSVSQIERMIEKQKQFNTLVSQQRTSYTNKDILNKSNQYIKDLENLKKQISDTGNVTEQQKSQITAYGNSIKQLSGHYQEAGTKGESFLQKISDKAKWLGAFYVVNELRQYFVKTITTVKETEDAVVSLQRVLNDDSVSQSRMTDELYDVAIQYGRTFDEVSEVAQQFVQAGNDWTDAVELTRGTMLALNTAELDVTQSTEGLIAIMAQWNLEAEDYADVIDKINITADNFAVTSEKIVAALQRSSSSAKNANISLEETIGIITALAESTGRSGENIGTALNSLIIYTSKSSALETFAKNGSDAMKQVVSDFNKGAASIYDVWVQLSKELSNLTASQQAALFNSEEYQEFADELESQAEEFTSQVNQIYGTAGTHRQNYFIALLNEMSTVEDVMKEMDDYQGYSAKENEKYMESLSASWNQLTAVMAELAVQAGEQGLMQFLKIIVQLAYETASLTKSLGGLLPLLTSISGIIITIKAEKVSKSISDFVKGIVDAKNNISAFISMVYQANGVVGKFDAANKLLNGSLTSLTGIIGVASVGISALVMIISGANAASEALKQKNLELAQSNLDNIDSIRELESEYTNIIESTEDESEKNEKLAEFKKKLITQYGFEKEALDNLNKSREEGIKLLREEHGANASEAWSNIADQYEESKKALKTPASDFNISELFGISQEAIDIMEQFGIAVKNAGFTDAAGLPKYQVSVAGEDIKEQVENLNDANAALRARGIEIDGLQDKINSLNKILEKNQESYDTGTEALANYLVTADDRFDSLRENIEDVSSFEKFRDSIIEAAEGDEYLIETIETILTELYPELASQSESIGEVLADSFSIPQETIDALSEKIDELNESIDGSQSGFDTVISAIEEYNENGYLTVDTIQSLIAAGGEYVSMLQFTADGVSLNEEKVRNLMDAQKQNIDSVLAAAYADDVLRISEKYLGEAFSVAGDEAQESGAKISNLIPEIGDLIQSAWEGGDAAYHLAEGLAAAANKTLSGSDMYAYQKELDEARQNWKNLGNEIQNSYKNSSVWSDKAATSASNAAKKQTDALKKQLEAQKEAIKDRYDAEIESLKEVQEENDRLQKQEEYYRNRQEALNDIEKAATRSGVDYREQESEARKKLEELDREWKETVADWSIEDKIAELEALRDAEVAAIDAQIDALEGRVSSLGTSMVNTYSSANKTMLSNYETEYLNPIKEETSEAYSTVFDEMPEMFGDALETILEQAKLNSMQLNNIYSVNFINPLSSSLQKIQQQMVALQVATPNLPYLPYTNGTGYFSNQSIVNNNTKNANVFANVYNQNSANSLLSGIWSKP